MTDAVTAAADQTPGTPPADDTPTQTPEQIAAAEAAAAEAAKAATAPVIGDEPVDTREPGPTSTDADENGVITYDATGYPGLDMALEFVGKLGIGMDHPAMVATADGDFSLIEAHLATLGDNAKGYERMVALAKEAHEQHVAKTTATTKAITEAVGAVLGETQAEVLAWAASAATPEEKASINAMLAADPVQARAAATTLLTAYQVAGGTVVTPASATIPNAGGRDPKQSATGPISKKEFAVETNKLHAKHGAAYTQTMEYRALAARLR